MKPNPLVELNLTAQLESKPVQHIYEECVAVLKLAARNSWTKYGAVPLDSSGSLVVTHGADPWESVGACRCRQAKCRCLKLEQSCTSEKRCGRSEAQQ